MYGKFSQIYANYCEKNVGVQKILAHVMKFGGNASRVYNVLVESNDKLNLTLKIFGFVLSCLCLG